MLNIWASQQQGGVPPPPDPTAITLLTSDTYAIGGVAKTYPECYAQNTSAQDGATIGIVAGQGLVVDYFGGGTATSASATLIATAALEAAINPEVGATGVIDITAVFSDPTEEIFGDIFIVGVAGTSIGFDLRPKGDGTGMRIAIRDASAGGNAVFTSVIGSVVSGQKYRLAFSLKPNLLMLSVNGSDVVSVVPAVTLDLSASFLSIYAAVSNAQAGAKAKIGDVHYYPFVTDSNVLKGMSG